MKRLGLRRLFLVLCPMHVIKQPIFYQRLNLYVMMKFKLFFIVLFCSLSLSAFSQLTYGTTGLLHAPSAEMQRDKTSWSRQLPEQGAHTAHLVLSYLQLFPERHHLPLSGSGLHVYALQGGGVGIEAIRVQRIHEPGPLLFRPSACVEGGAVLEIHAAVVLGTSDPFTSSGGGQVGTTEGNGYYSRFYIAASKHIPVVGKEEIGVHLSYLYNNRKEYKLNGFALGVTYNPTFHPQLRVIAEYDSKDFALGATYLLFKHLHVQVEMQRMKYFTGGLTYKIHLK